VSFTACGRGAVQARALRGQLRIGGDQAFPRDVGERDRCLFSLTVERGSDALADMIEVMCV
jgi:hypothetical protein